MQGAMGERLCWKPLAQRLQVTPVTPSLHGHWPVVWLHVFPAAPTGWQSHAEEAEKKSQNPAEPGPPTRSWTEPD